MKPFNLFPHDININFMRLRWLSLIVAAAIMFVGIGAMPYSTVLMNRWLAISPSL